MERVAAACMRRLSDPSKQIRAAAQQASGLPRRASGSLAARVKVAMNPQSEHPWQGRLFSIPEYAERMPGPVTCLTVFVT